MNCTLQVPCPWNSSGKSTGVGCHCLHQGAFLTQGLNLRLLHSRQILYHLSHQGSPSKTEGHCSAHRVVSGSKRELSHSSVFFLPQGTSIAEVLCLTAFFGRLVHFAKVTPQKVFWKDTKNICVMVTIVVSACYSAFQRLWSKAESMKRLGRFEWVQENDGCWESKHQRHNRHKTTREVQIGQNVTM